jgi:hypothetical protein
VSCTGNGNYVATIRTLRPNNYTVSVFLNNTISSGNVPAPFVANFSSGVLSTKYSIAYGDGVSKNASNIAGYLATFYIQSFNQYGVAIYNRDLCQNTTYWAVNINPAFSAYAPNLNNVSISKCDDNGQYTVTYNATWALQYYTVSISFNKTLLATTYQAQILPDVMDPNMTIVEGLNGTSTSADNGTFQIQTRDKWGNDEITATATDFGVFLSPFCANTTINKTVNGGKLSCYYEVREGGIYCVSITYKNTVVTLENSRIFAVDGTACSGGCSQQGFCFKTSSPSTSTDEYSCSCFQGYVGDNCENKLSSTYPLSVGAIIGLVVGIGILMLIIGIIVGFFCLRRLRKGEDNRPLID